MSARLSRCCAVAIMAKAPEAGAAKTRLIPALSPQDAARLSACFIRDAAANVAAAARQTEIEGYIAYSPPGAADAFALLLADGIRLLPSRRIGLGASLCDAAEDLLGAGYGSVCLVNSDSPTLPTSVLVEAARTLTAPGDRVVLGPAEDGGYYLIGLKRAHRRLFDDIAWSTPRVFAQTVERAHEIGLDAVTLPRWYDVDDIASLRRLQRELSGGREHGAPYPAPHTAALLRELLGNDGDRRSAADSAGILPDPMAP